MIGAIVPVPSGPDVEASFEPVAGEPSLIRSLRTLLGPGRIPESVVVVSVDADHAGSVRQLLAAAGLSGITVCGGAFAERAECIGAGLQLLEREGISEVLVHDHRHPLTPTVVSDRVLEALRGGSPVVLPVLAMTDSVKAVDERDRIVGTLDRETLRTVQYPRGYTVNALRALRDDDYAAVLLSPQLKPTIVEGDVDGGRFDLPADAALLAALIASRATG